MAQNVEFTKENLLSMIKGCEKIIDERADMEEQINKLKETEMAKEIDKLKEEVKAAEKMVEIWKSEERKLGKKYNDLLRKNCELKDKASLTDDVANCLVFEKEENDKLKRIYGVNIYGDSYLRYTIYDQCRTHYYLVAIDVRDGYKAQDEHKHICVMRHIIEGCLQEEDEIYNCVIEEYEFVPSFKELKINLPH